MTTGALALDFDNGGQETTIDEDGVKLDSSGLPELPHDANGVVVDPSLDPERANAITARALADDVDVSDSITIEGPPDGSCHLAAGYVTEDGTRYTTAEVKELTGRDEEALAKALATGDLARYLDAIVKAGVVSLGPVTDPQQLPAALDSLLVGDRDILVLQIRRNAYGDTSRLGVKCPYCEAEFEVDYSYSTDVPMKPFKVEGMTDPSQRLFDVECPSGRVVKLRLVDGKAQKAVYTGENFKKTDAELNTLLLRELAVEIDGRPVKGVGPVLELPARDRQHLLKWLAESQPGPQYADVKQECAECIKEFPLVMTLRDMFRGD